MVPARREGESVPTCSIPVVIEKEKGSSCTNAKDKIGKGCQLRKTFGEG